MKSLEVQQPPCNREENVKDGRAVKDLGALMTPLTCRASLNYFSQTIYCEKQINFAFV